MVIRRGTSLFAVLLVLAAPAAFSAHSVESVEPRASLVTRLKVWRPTDIPSKNLWTGPSGPGSFDPGATIDCAYREKKLTGDSPKFWCEPPGAEALKVKYGDENGEVYGEVIASRLLWALGFGADWMYPVRVICHGCPDRIRGTVNADGGRVIDPADVERKMPATTLSDHWSWKEIERIDEAAGGATRAERDAFKLLAVLIFHGDSKPVQQRIVCLGAVVNGRCAAPFVFIQDVGSTFGSAKTFSGPDRLSVNLARWSREPIWKDSARCVANLHGLLASTLHDPVISEGGRRFLAGLLMQLSDRQLRDLFTAARVNLRPRMPKDAASGHPAIGEWVDAFKQKRAAIVDHRCPE